MLSLLKWAAYFVVKPFDRLRVTGRCVMVFTDYENKLSTSAGSGLRKNHKKSHSISGFSFLCYQLNLFSDTYAFKISKCTGKTGFDS